MVQNVPVLRAFGGGQHDLVSPFVMLDEFGPFEVNPGDVGMDIKAHPHAGVVPTTFLVQGSGRHTDSIHNDIVYREGQFMLFSSGRGAIHEEVSDDQLRKEGGTVQGFQIWLNLPAKEKFRNYEAETKTGHRGQLIDSLRPIFLLSAIHSQDSNTCLLPP